MRWQSFGVALGLHTCAVLSGQWIIRSQFDSMVAGSVARAQKVVDAIRAFEVIHGHAPSQLSELAPEFLPSDPTLLYENGPALYYEPASEERPVPMGRWSIVPYPVETIELEYSPKRLGREPWPPQRRVGDWLVAADARVAAWPDMTLHRPSR